MMKKSSLLICLLMGILSLSCLVGYAAFINVTASDTSIEESEPTTAAKIVAFSTTTSSYYTRVSKAIGDTESGGTCYILPFNYADDTPWGKEGLDASSAVLDEDATLVSGATLTLPMGFEDNSITGTALWDGRQSNSSSDTDICYEYDSNTYPQKLTGQVTADSSSSSIKKYRCSALTIEEEITLTVNGTLNVGGVTGKAGQYVEGQTTGCYSEIVMATNSNLIINGTAVCNGYIKENERENGSQVTVNNGGTLTAPLVFYDFCGGGNTYGNYDGGNEFPLEQWDMPNLQSTITVNYGGTLNGYWDIYVDTGSKHFCGSASIVATSNAFIILDTTSSYAIMKYHPHWGDNNTTYWGNNDISNQYWNNSTDAWTPPNYKGVDGNTYNALTTDLQIYHGASFGSLSISIKMEASVFNLGIDADSSKYFLPMSYRYQLGLYDGTYNAPYKVKFLPGSSLHVHEGATINQTANMIFYQSWPTPPDSSTTGKTYNCRPNLGVDANGYDWSRAHLIVDGSWIVNSGASFGGYVETSSANGHFTLLNGSTASVTTKECYNGYYYSNIIYPFVHGEVDSVDITESATGPFLSSDSQVNQNFSTNASYGSYNNEDYYYWSVNSLFINVTGDYSSYSIGSSTYSSTSPIAFYEGGSVVASVTYSNSWMTSVTKTLSVVVTDDYGNTLFSDSYASVGANLTPIGTNKTTLTVSISFTMPSSNVSVNCTVS